MSHLEIYDKEIFEIIQNEQKRQKNNIELIASENFVSNSVLEAAGSILTNKYAEGYPSKRYYGGCEEVDKIENIAIERLKRIFGAEHANVQPHSGSQANAAVYFSVLEHGDSVLGMNLSHGGHLTHGSPVNFSGKTYQFFDYGVDSNTQLINYDEVQELALKHKPKLIVAGASAYPREIDFARFRKIADSIGAYFMVDMAHIAGLVAAGIHPNPVPYADFVTSTTHKTLRGPRGGIILCKEKYAKLIDKAIFPGIQGGPLMHIIAAKAVAFNEVLSDEFNMYIKQVVLNSKVLGEELQKRNIKLVSGGTDNHLLLIDVSDIGISGKHAEKVLDEIGITVNKNTIPFDPTSPFVTSGIRIGTPAVTTRGFKEKEMIEIADIISSVLLDSENETLLNELKIRVSDLTEKFPL